MHVPRAIRFTLGAAVYATMQPMLALCCPSASIGAEQMGSDSEALDATAKRVAKESIVVWAWKCVPLRKRCVV